jgi:hypothetical protein
MVEPHRMMLAPKYNRTVEKNATRMDVKDIKTGST